jgi:hypothetical protein
LFFFVGPSYIRPNQTALYRYEQRVKKVDKEHKKIMDQIKKSMSDLKDRPRILSTARVFKLYSERLRAYLIQRYMAPLSFIDRIRARRELKLVQSIRRKLKKYKLVLRETDKSGVFHNGPEMDYEQKATAYRMKTRAYEELPSDPHPLNDVFVKVGRLLNQLRSAEKIREWQKKKMMPIRAETELAYMYFVPKTHKVTILIFCASSSFIILYF